MRVAIIQPNYISWRGHFNFFKLCDTFVFYDDVQYTMRDWRNRNIIKTPDGPQWLTIPVHSKGLMLINEVKMQDNDWQSRHIDLLERNYKNAPYFGEVSSMLIEAYREEKESLSKLNVLITRKILDYVGIRCKTLLSSELGHADLKSTDRLVALCKHLEATEYYSGEVAKGYLETGKFGDIRVVWHRYREKVYPQLWGDFQSRVSIIDTLFNCGPKAYDII